MDTLIGFFYVKIFNSQALKRIAYAQHKIAILKRFK